MRSPEIVQTSPQSGMATVEEGQHVTLSCSAIGNPDPTITWRRKNGKRMKYINMKNGLTKKSKIIVPMARPPQLRYFHGDKR